MNILIVSNKTDAKTYEKILKAAPNTSVLGAVTNISNNFVSDIKRKYNPHALLIDTSVPTKTITVKDTIIEINKLYPYIKIIVMTDEDDNEKYDAFAVVQGQITNLEFNKIIEQAQEDIEQAKFELLSNEKENGTEELTNEMTVPINYKNKVDYKNDSSAEKLDKLSNLKVKIPKLKFKKLNKKHFIKTPLFISLLSVLFVAFLFSLIILLKLNNPNNTVIATNDETSKNTVVSTSPTEVIPTEDELIISFTDPTDSVKNTETVISEKSDSDTVKIENEINNKTVQNSGTSNSSKSTSSSEKKEQSSNNKNDVSISYNDNKYNNTGNNDVNSIKISYNSKNLKVGEYITLKATTYPVTKSVKWSSSNSKVATVTSNGTVKAISPGTANIYASVDGITSKCIVNISPKPTTQPTTKDPVSLSSQSYNIVSGQIITITLNNSSGCVWKISNPSVVQVCGGGSNKISVKGVKTGSTTITATNNSTGKSYSCSVKIS